MNVNEVISSGLLESYVLGATTEEENIMIQSLCQKHPELVKEIELIEKGLLEFSSQLNAPLRPELKDKIFARLGQNEEKPADTKIIAMHQGRLRLYRAGIAASLLLFVISIAYNIILQQKLNRVNGELSALSSSKSYMAGELKIQQASMKDMSHELQIISDPKIKKIALTGMNSLASKLAAVHWNTQTNEIYFNATALPLPANKQYQLWAIVNGKPVDAGVIDLSGDSVFQKMKTISNAQAFAVTVENPGGSATPSLETMCLLGNV